MKKKQKIGTSFSILFARNASIFLKSILFLKASVFRMAVIGLLPIFSILNAQPPQGISYQAIARNSIGQPIATTTVRLRFSIRDSIPAGPVLFRETHSATTSTLGLFSVSVGMGSLVSGSFSSIKWAINNKFLQVEMDPAGGNSFTDLGTTQMMSVPYALNAGSAISWTPIGTGYGEVKLYNCDGLFQYTPCLPKISSTLVASEIIATSASSGGVVSADGGTPVVSRGICWSTIPNPTVDLSTKTVNGTGTGSFTSRILGLSPNTQYFVRAYATNASGTVYGNQVSFRTTPYSDPIDIEGNVYNTLSIGNQVWMKENLKVGKYRNGNPIPTGLTPQQWIGSQNGAMVSYNNPELSNTYGKLYNWFAVVDPRGLCPTDWHVPTDHDWNLLIKFLEPSADTTQCCSNTAGGKLKTVCCLWASPNTGATNETGFSALPGGQFLNSSTFSEIGSFGYWWTSGVSLVGEGIRRSIRSSSSVLFKGGGPNQTGQSVRCVRD